MLQFLDLKSFPCFICTTDIINFNYSNAKQVSVDLRVRLRFELNTTYRWAEAHYGLRCFDRVLSLVRGERLEIRQLSTLSQGLLGLCKPRAVAMTDCALVVLSMGHPVGLP